MPRKLPLALFLGLAVAQNVFSHGGIYVSRVYTSSVLYDLVPSHEISKGKKEVNISTLYGWTPKNGNSTIVENSAVTGNTLCASLVWGLSQKLAVSILAAGLEASGPEPIDEKIPLGFREDFRAKGFTGALALVYTPIHREHFQLPLIIGGGWVWVNSYFKSAGAQGNGNPYDQWHTPAIVFGLAPRLKTEKLLFTFYGIMRRTSESHDQLKPLIASGQHSKQDFMDPNAGIELTYRPFNLALAYLALRDNVQSLALRWSRQW